MEEEFIPYEQALALKELGYDKGSFACVLGDGFNIFDTRVSYNTNKKFPHCYDVPLYQQAFSFLLNIIKDVSITYWNDESGNLKYFGRVVPFYDFDTKQECLSILIEIAKKEIT